MFSKKPDQTTPTKKEQRPVANGSSTFSVIGGDVIVTGDLKATADLHVDGTVNGDISCSALVQGEESVIEGAIDAQSARLSGAVKGTISVRELTILKSARIEGDVHYEALTIEQGATVEGRFAPKSPKTSTASPASKASGTQASDDDGEPKLTLAT